MGPWSHQAFEHELMDVPYNGQHQCNELYGISNDYYEQLDGCEVELNGTIGNDAGDPFFDWDRLDKAYQQAKHDELAIKLKHVISHMRMMRSKAYWKEMKKLMRMRRSAHKKMQRMRKHENQYFNWDELDQAEKHEQCKEKHEAETERNLYFDWDELEKSIQDEIKAMRRKFMKTTSTINLEAMRQQDEVKVSRKMKRIQNPEAISNMLEIRRNQLHEARGGVISFWVSAIIN